MITVNAPAQACNPANLNVSINSTSQDGCPDVDLTQSQYQQPVVANTTYSVLAINDLGMHCGDLDTRIASILPPFQVLLTQVIQKGSCAEILGPSQVDVFYSAAANPIDPILTQTARSVHGPVVERPHLQDQLLERASPALRSVLSAERVWASTRPATGGFVVPPDKGLPVPNVENLYIGPDGRVNSGDEVLTAVQHAMPGITRPVCRQRPAAGRGALPATSRSS